jgi:hypothetical protein
MPEPAIIHYVHVWELRAMFNRLEFIARSNIGELTIRPLYSRIPRESAIPHHPGTRKEIIEFRDAENRTVAVAKLFRLPDGSIAYSGRPDPSKVVDGEIVYKISARREEGRLATPWCVMSDA